MCTHVAFDNYDRFMDTINGKETLHAVGIIHQYKANNHEKTIDIDDNESLDISNPSTSKCNKRRKFNVIPREICTYSRTPRAATCLHSYEY